MIATDKRKAIFLLHQEGMAEREIARKLGLSRNTVRTIIRQGGERPPRVRTDKKRLAEELLRQLHHQCKGRIVRVHEKLVEEHGIAVCYSTLTQMLRELGISSTSSGVARRSLICKLTFAVHLLQLAGAQAGGWAKSGSKPNLSSVAFTSLGT